MFENKGTNWNFPTWEQEQEMKRMAEIQARAFQEAAQKSAQQYGYVPKRVNPMAEHIRNAVTSAPDYEAKRQQSLRKAQEMKSKGGLTAAFGAVLESICK